MNPYEDIIYAIDGVAAIITINRPERYNAFRGQTVDELIHAMRAAWSDAAVRAIILTGAGDRAFCSGGDVKQRAETGDYGPTESGRFEIEYFHRLLRDVQAIHSNMLAQIDRVDPDRKALGAASSRTGTGRGRGDASQDALDVPEFIPRS